MTEEKPTAAFVLSLVAGIFILLGGGMMSMLGSFMGQYGFGMMGGYGGFGGMMGYGRYPFGVMGAAFGVLGVLGLVFGVIVIISALMLNKKPAEHSTWGTVIVVFSVLSIFGSAMGGFGVGLILGLIGGILGITWKPPEAKT
ncbi:MAG: DUF6114 domain-containing protein [Candidatus Bathyarchaeia archaeon]|jgi:hypothetical protein